MVEQLLSLSEITRSFGAINALKDVSFDVKPGEVMGLVGENGAGKSSLVKIIGGFDSGFSGQFTFAGKQARFSGPVMAERAGIAIAQQELSLIPTMSVAENVLLVGDNVPKIATKRQLRKLVKPFLLEVGLDYIDPATSVERLSVGERHLVEVARLIAHDPQLLILDEPTAALGETDSIRILEMVERLVKRGKSVIYVSHRLDEIFKICDRITILRDGRSVAVKKTQELSVSELVNLMLGRELENMFPKRISSSSKTPLLRVRNLWPDGLLEPVDIDIFPGEILGLAGQLGSGTGEILSAIAGAHSIRGGNLEMDGRVFMPKTPNDAINAKIAYCSE
ncbi:MAG: sugar ABC transporter ATP-binding protein, partial [Alphaproteobacteria bacterium]|nr:sugar ABC transporter ATP-binding protein [Alphaproteobacteria bacterium]